MLELSLNPMKIAIGADHAGFNLKEHLRQTLVASGYQVEDLGTNSDASVDYPDYASAVAHKVASGAADRGVLVCSTGVGMSIAANKVAGVRAAMAQEVAQRLGSVNHSLVLCGHTHVPRVVQSGGSLIVNPGSVGLQAYDGVHPWLHHIETGAPQARYALAESGPAGWQITLRQVPYDHLTQAEVARRNGRPDWAHALATGWVLPL